MTVMGIGSANITRSREANMNTEFWKRPDGSMIDAVNGDTLAALLAKAAALTYLDDTLSDLNDAENKLELTAERLDRMAHEYSEYTLAANKAFDNLRTLLNELAYQMPYENGLNAQVSLVIGFLDRVRRHCPTMEINEHGRVIISDDIPF